MSLSIAIATGACAFLLTYLAYSSATIVVTALVMKRLQEKVAPSARVLIWKLALVLPLTSAFYVSVFGFPHIGMTIPLASAVMTEDPLSIPGPDANPARWYGIDQIDGLYDPSDSQLSESDFGLPAAQGERLSSDETATSSGAWSIRERVCLVAVVCWWGAVCWGFVKLRRWVLQLQRLRYAAGRVSSPELLAALNRLRTQFGIARDVQLLRSSNSAGPLTGGIRRPFIMLPNRLECDDEQRDALLAHELAHVLRRDVIWNLLVQVFRRAFPFQPLLAYAGKRLRQEMDFAADALAAQTLSERLGLARCLLLFGHEAARRDVSGQPQLQLAACMASFDSVLGRRIDALLVDDPVSRSFGRLGVFIVTSSMLAGSVMVAVALPRAVANPPTQVTSPQPLTHSGNSEMKKPLSTLALLTAMAAPVLADEPQSESRQAVTNQTTSAPLKTSADPLPDGVVHFNGMLVGRLSKKDVETGTFLVTVDAVSRVWRNSKAENPKSLVGKTVEISGVFGKFLDVLVTTRKGETLEFECKHDGERLVFPGEMLRKIAAFDPSDYPELPEEFRGFEGTVAGTVVKKDPETLELIFKINRVTKTWDSNRAPQPKSIEGKPLLLAGFWNRKDDYHKLKVGDRLEVGMKHIGMRSDHLTVAEQIRKADQDSDGVMMKSDSQSAINDGLPKGQNGFRGMLVGRLVDKDIERGTFAITVDAVPRVWNKNQASDPKSFLGKKVVAEGVTGPKLDVLVVAKKGETIQFGAFHEGGERMRVVEELRKVAPVKPGDYPVLPDGFRGFNGMVKAKVIRKDDHLLALTVEITDIESTFAANRAKQADSIIGKQAMLAGFWQRKDAFHNINVGDTIRCGIEHPQRLSDHLSVIESVKKVSP